MNDSYLFGVSAVRVYETKMLTFNDFLNLAGRNSYNEVSEELKRRGYIKPGKYSVEEALKHKEKELTDKLLKAGIRIPDVFFLENDFYNIELTVKCIYAGLEPEHLLKELSNPESRSLFKQLKNGSQGKYTHIANHGLSLLNEDGNTHRCEQYIRDKLTETGINNSDSVFFREWFKLLSSLNNADSKNENIKINFLRKHKYDTFSIAPVFGFFYGTLTELRNIRTVLSGKKAGADKEEITERLCLTYA
ncbi:MAG: V-type ATPase subunit [Clostridia bacterium]|nr:V-type ATPase subunit [Clostridia bacterium]